MEKLNGDLHQTSGIRYVSRSFSVRYLVSLAYGKGLISAVTLSVVVAQAIGIFLCNNSIHSRLYGMQFLHVEIHYLLNVLKFARRSRLRDSSKYSQGFKDQEGAHKNNKKIST